MAAFRQPSIAFVIVRPVLFFAAQNECIIVACRYHRSADPVYIATIGSIESKAIIMQLN